MKPSFFINTIVNGFSYGNVSKFISNDKNTFFKNNIHISDTYYVQLTGSYLVVKLNFFIYDHNRSLRFKSQLGKH